MVENFELEELHSELLEVLCNFEILCKEIGIDYFLIAGSLLGAIRHRGFIPWDDDVDLGMTRSDYNKLIDYFKRNQNLTYELYCHDTNKNCHLIFCKFVDKSKPRESLKKYFDECSNISIDVFPYDKCESKKVVTLIKFLRIKYFKFIIQSKDKLKDPKYKESKIKRVARIILSSPYSRVDIEEIFIAISKLVNEQQGGNDYINYCGKYTFGKEVITDAELHPLRRSEFESKAFYVPCKYEAVLNTTYGKDWMVVPDLSKREQHSH